MLKLHVRLKLIALCATLICSITACGEVTPKWNSPKTVSLEVMKSVLPTSLDLEAYSSLNQFSSKKPSDDVLVGFFANSDNSIEFSPKSCVESDSYLTRDDFWVTSASNATNNMTNGISRVWDAGEGWRLKVLIVGDKNTSNDSYLMEDISTELASCKVVAVQTKTLMWSSVVEKFDVSSDSMRIEFKMLFTPGNSVTKGIKIVQQVGRNLVSVTVARSGKGFSTDFPIPTDVEKDMNALLMKISEGINQRGK